MLAPTIEDVSVEPPPPRKKMKTWLKVLLSAVGGIVLLCGGFAGLVAFALVTGSYGCSYF